MARLNIEDPFWLEVISVVAKVGDQDKAVGNAIRFFRFAQEKHKAGQLVSEDDFKRQGFLEALIPTFAERVSGGIRAVGAQKHFGWLAARVEAGRRGGSKPKQTKAKRSKVKQLEPSPSPSYSSSSSDSSVGESDASAPPTHGNPLVSEYYECWRAKHGDRAPLLPQDFQKLKQLGEQFGEQAARSLVRNYFRVPNDWFQKKRHDVQTLMSNLSEVQAYIAKNSKPKIAQSVKVDAMAGGSRALERVPDARPPSAEELAKLAHLGISIPGKGA